MNPGEAKFNPGAGNPRARSMDAIEATAAEWLALREERAFTPAEEKAFRTWLAADSRRAAAVAELESAWRTFDRLRRYPRSASQPVDPDFFARSRDIAPAEAMMDGAPPRRRGPSNNAPNANSGGPASRLRKAYGGQAARAGDDSLAKWRGPFRPLPVALAAAAAITLVVWLWFPLAKPSEEGPVFTAKGAEPRILRLPDGSHVELKPDSEIVEQFAPRERRVRLVRGEAHFAVTKNHGRPFIVETNGVMVRAIGTAFNVRLGAMAVEILVTEGKVYVAGADEASGGLSHEAWEPPPDGGSSRNLVAPAQNAGQGFGDAAADRLLPSGSRPPAFAPLFLEASQRVIVSTIPAASAPAPVIENLTLPAIDRMLAWQVGRLVFEATPLSEAVERFNRYSTKHGGTRLVLHDRELGALRISGRFRSDNGETFAELLEASFGVAVERRDNEILLSRSP